MKNILHYFPEYQSQNQENGQSGKAAFQAQTQILAAYQTHNAKK
jgi:hypothetical protein